MPRPPPLSPKGLPLYSFPHIIMSQTAVDTGTDSVRTVTLQNGHVFSFKSNISTRLDKIPVIDASRMWSENIEDRKSMAREVRHASRNIGFFYLINHVGSGMPPSK